MARSAAGVKRLGPRPSSASIPAVYEEASDRAVSETTAGESDPV